nr:hypothetical protein [Thiomicrorhabdus indica]
MSQVIYGLDIGKSTFHLISRDSHGHEVIRKKFTRSKLLEFFTNHSPTTVALEACAEAVLNGRQDEITGYRKRGNKTLRELLIHGARAMLSRPDLAEKAYGNG